MAQLTLKTGFDVDYYLDQVGADYYLTAGEEPPGAPGWAQALGRPRPDRSRSTRRRCAALYHHDVGPEGEPLATQAAQGLGMTARRPRIGLREAITAAVTASRPVRDAGGDPGDRAPGEGEDPDSDTVLRLHTEP